MLARPKTMHPPKLISFLGTCLFESGVPDTISALAFLAASKIQALKKKNGVETATF